MNIAMNKIQDFLSNKNIAIVGASRSKTAMSNSIIAELLKLNYSVSLVNPSGAKIQGIDSCKSLNDLPPNVTSILVVTNKKVSDGVLKQAIELGYNQIWVQRKSETVNSEKYCCNGINLITNQCVIMYLNNTGVHKLHKSILGFFGKLPT